MLLLIWPQRISLFFSNLRGLLTLIVPCLARNVGTGNLSAHLVEHEKRLEPRGPHEIATLTSS